MGAVRVFLAVERGTSVGARSEEGDVGVATVPAWPGLGAKLSVVKEITVFKKITRSVSSRVSGG